MDISGSMGAEVTDNRELNRRNAASKTKFIAKIFVNGKQVIYMLFVSFIFTNMSNTFQ